MPGLLVLDPTLRVVALRENCSWLLAAADAAHVRQAEPQVTCDLLGLNLTVRSRRFYNFSLPEAETAATKISFSSYPGVITSPHLKSRRATCSSPMQTAVDCLETCIFMSAGTDAVLY